jgi:hypothetical protein
MDDGSIVALELALLTSNTRKNKWAFRWISLISTKNSIK